jgi:succinyl-CoA synthetase alpha subunit
MGHAGAIISGGKGTAVGKVSTLEACGISVAESPAEIANALLAVYEPQGAWRHPQPGQHRQRACPTP